MSAVHDFTKDVSQINPRNSSTLHFVDVLMKYDRGISKITQREWIVHVPALFSESLPLNGAGVEVTQSKQNALQFDVFVIKILFGEECPSSLHISSQTSWWFIS